MAKILRLEAKAKNIRSTTVEKENTNVLIGRWCKDVMEYIGILPGQETEYSTLLAGASTIETTVSEGKNNAFRLGDWVLNALEYVGFKSDRVKRKLYFSLKMRALAMRDEHRDRANERRLGNWFVQFLEYIDYEGDTNMTKIFIMTLNITSSYRTIKLPFNYNQIDVFVDWGDGSTGEYTGDPTYTYQSDGEFTIQLYGKVRFFDTSNNLYSNFRKVLRRIDNWGKLDSMRFKLNGCTNLIFLADNPNPFIETVSDGSAMFTNCTSLKNIPDNFFKAAKSLTTVELAFGNTNFTKLPDYLYANLPNLSNVRRVFFGMKNLVESGKYLFENSGIYSFGELFQSCTSLKYVDGSIFNGCNPSTGEDSFSGCTSLEEVGDGIFDGFDKMIKVEKMFYNCKKLRKIPNNLFEGCTSLIRTDDLFYNCSDLKTIGENMFKGCINIDIFPRTFSYSGLESIPENLFKDCAKLKTLSSTFSNCKNLTQVPANLLKYNTELHTLENTFRSCGLLSVPSTLFFNNEKLYTLQGVFAYNNIASIDENFFVNNSQITTLDSTFAYNKITHFPSNLLKSLENLSSISALMQNNLLNSVHEDTFKHNTKLYYATSAISGNNITSIPVNLLRYNTRLSRLSVFSENPITSIHKDVFKYNVNAIDARSCFFKCKELEEIPEGIFYHNINLVNVDDVFRESGIKRLPSYLFINCPKITSISGLCEACYNMEEIPEHLLEGTDITSINNAFTYCNKLKTIPEDLFKYSPNLQRLGIFFRNCTSLTGIPNLLFANNKQVTYFNYIFEGCTELRGTTPKGDDGYELWERAGKPGYPTSIIGESCFYNCKNLSNYDDIPKIWKGVK